MSNNRSVIHGLVCAGYLLAGAVLAQPPVTLTVETQSPGNCIPPRFSGLSFETGSLQYNSPRVSGYLFESTNRQLLKLFRNLGIRNLRIGGTSVDTNHQAYVPAHQDIDALFGFAKAAQVKVIYSLRLLNGSSSRDAAAARYVWGNYRPYLSCLAIGNEPNLYRDRAPKIRDGASLVAA